MSDAGEWENRAKIRTRTNCAFAPETCVAKEDRLFHICQRNFLDCFKSRIIVCTKWRFGVVSKRFYEVGFKRKLLGRRRQVADREILPNLMAQGLLDLLPPTIFKKGLM